MGKPHISNSWVLLFNLDRSFSSSKHLVGAMVRFPS